MDGGMSYSEKSISMLMSSNGPNDFRSGGHPMKFGTASMKKKIASCPLLRAVQTDVNGFKS